MKSLLIVAHGSRHEKSNNEVRKLTSLVSGIPHDFVEVQCAFLELASPSIPDGITLLAEKADEIIILPYFLSAGRHVTLDIPKEVESSQANHPNIKITISSHIGSSPDFPQIILNQVNKTLRNASEN